MIKTILEAQGLHVVHNASGANLLNGIVSACIQEASWDGKLHADYGVFEVDENTLPRVVAQLKTQNSPPKADQPLAEKLKATTQNVKFTVVLLNLFRDQLDRYGEVDVVAEKWEKALDLLETRDRTKTRSVETTLIMNADDPLIAFLGKVVGSRPGLEARVLYFGLDDTSQFQKKMEHATDSIFCLNCGGRLAYTGVYYSHIGIWYCKKCKEKRPIPDVSEWKSPLPGLYNQYNTLAAVSVAKALHINDKDIEASLATFQPAFGRQEEFEINGKKVKIFLSKNPAGFNQSLRTVLELGASQILFVLNDRIPDGRDVSWIWDVDFEVLAHDEHKMKERDERVITVSGDRVYDLALRFKYAGISIPNQNIYEDLVQAVKESLTGLPLGEILYVLATYSAMLEVRKIVTGRKIL